MAISPHRTPDGKYLIIEGASGPRLWRSTNPNLSDAERSLWVRRLMAARRAVRAAGGDEAQTTAARRSVDEAKRALGERGPVWWSDGAPDLNRHLVKDSPYRDWWDQGCELE